MLIGGIFSIIIGIIILSLTIIKTVKMMKIDNNTKISKNNNKFDDLTEISSSIYNDIDHEAKNRYFKGNYYGFGMESENPKIIKTWCFGFGLTWFFTITGWFLLHAYFFDVNIKYKVFYFFFDFCPVLYCIIIGFKYKNKK